MLNEKNILITGGTGSLGQRLVEYMLNCDPHSIRIFSRNESKQVEMDKKFNDKRLRFLIGDVQDEDRLVRAMKNVEIVVHAAALKHISVCEYNPHEAIKTNITGAVNIIDAALETNVKKVLFISSDKAVYPTTFYGATKMTAEKLFIQSNFYSSEHGPMFSCVRFGNLVGSSGSVIPLFKEQNKKGFVTITHKDMTRFWITLDDAADFIYQCIDLMQGGEIFVPKMHSVRIIDIAKAVAPNAEQRIIGLRVGEKIHEDIILEYENIVESDTFFIVTPHFPHSVSMGGQKEFYLKGSPGFSYRSDTNPLYYTVKDLKKLIV